MEKHVYLSDKEFETHFKNCTLDPEIFTHEAHLRLAWIHLKNYGLEQAIENIPSQLKAFVHSLDAFDKYNETVTIAAIRAVHHFREKSRSGNFPEFIAEFPRLRHNFRDLLGCHYGFDIFKSATAKQEYLEPDLLPFE